MASLQLLHFLHWLQTIKSCSILWWKVLSLRSKKFELFRDLSGTVLLDYLNARPENSNLKKDSSVQKGRKLAKLTHVLIDFIDSWACNPEMSKKSIYYFMWCLSFSSVYRFSVGCYYEKKHGWQTKRGLWKTLAGIVMEYDNGVKSYPLVTIFTTWISTFLTN